MGSEMCIRDSTYTGPEEATLNNQQSASGSGAWEPKDEEGYIDIRFNKIEHLGEIRTQGSPSSEKYVRMYFLLYSQDGDQFKTYIGVGFILLLIE